MAKVATAYADNQGKLHPTPDAAVLADLMVILGRIGAEGGITAGLAQIVLEKRREIEAVFADLDVMTGGPSAGWIAGGKHAEAA